jgi:hypothetical protein
MTCCDQKLSTLNAIEWLLCCVFIVFVGCFGIPVHNSLLPVHILLQMKTVHVQMFKPLSVVCISC